MKYIALLTTTQEQRDAWRGLSPEELAAARADVIPEWEAFYAELGPTGKLGFSAELLLPDTAKTVRVRDGEMLVTDGPFAETKEQLGGVIEIDAADLDDAISVAARIPVARNGSVELRPIIEH